MNRSKYAVVALRVLKEYAEDGNYWLTLSQIDEQMKEKHGLDIDEISRDTKRRALHDLLELDLIKKKNRKYTHKNELERQKEITIDYLKHPDERNKSERIAEEYSDKLLPRRVREIARKVITKTDYDLPLLPGHKFTPDLDNSETEKIINRIENL